LEISQGYTTMHGQPIIKFWCSLLSCLRVKWEMYVCRHLQAEWTCSASWDVTSRYIPCV